MSNFSFLFDISQCHTLMYNQENASNELNISDKAQDLKNTRESERNREKEFFERLSFGICFMMLLLWNQTFSNEFLVDIVFHPRWILQRSFSSAYFIFFYTFIFFLLKKKRKYKHRLHFDDQLVFSKQKMIQKFLVQFSHALHKQHSNNVAIHLLMSSSWGRKKKKQSSKVKS